MDFFQFRCYQSLSMQQFFPKKGKAKIYTSVNLLIRNVIQVQRPLCPRPDCDLSLPKHLWALSEYCYLLGLSMTVSRHKWDKPAAVININMNSKMLISDCIKHEFKIHLQNVHIAQFWHRLSTSWQEGAVSPAVFTLSFLLKKIRFCLVVYAVCFPY